MVHVGREPGDDVRARVVGKHGLTGLVEDVDHVVDCLDNVAVPDAESLVGRLDGELVPAARVPLLEQVQALELALELRLGFRLGGAADSRPLAAALGQADPARQLTVERLRSLVAFFVLGLAGELLVHGCPFAGWREVSGLRATRPDLGDKACCCAGRACSGSCGCCERADGQRQN